MYLLLGRRSALTTHNKLVLYKTDFETCMDLWHPAMGCTKPSNIAVISDSKTRYSGTMLMHPGTLGTLTFIETLKCKWSRQKFNGSQGSMKRGFIVMPPSKQSSCSTTANC
jgi:hypothetical protein